MGAFSVDKNTHPDPVLREPWFVGLDDATGQKAIWFTIVFAESLFASSLSEILCYFVQNLLF
jgi:hypothetical protein